WKGKPDGILKDVQVGNVSLNLPTQLIKPANNLFGVSTTMQFGKTKVTTVFSQNKGQSTETVLKGGAQLNEFKISADNYDQNRHFFLAQFFRDNYDEWLENLPIVASGVVINRVEVWVTNRNANVETPRDIMAYMDLGEPKPYRNNLNGTGTGAADNNANGLFAQIEDDDLARRSPTAIDRLYSLFPNFEQTVDFDLLNYARQLNEKEFSLNSQLGYISLTQPLNNDEILAVAFEYTYNGNTYQVGEFSRDVAPGDQNVLHLKMLKGNTIRTRLPIWKLMMKNIYALNTYQLSLEDFKLNLIYADDTSGADYNYLPVTADLPALKGGNPLLRVVGLDKLNRQQEAKPDGVFDAIEGITINTQYARIIFPVVEPFGESLREKFDAYNDLADYYCFDALYDSTKWLAQQDVKHNKFFLTGSFKSANGAELYLGTTNLQRGSVRVTANGRPLQEGLDYEVDYALGRVRITNQGLLQGGAEIRASAD
ncbi:MAG: cell surface protein SprA, partial [Bacteroidia bacterium]